MKVRLNLSIISENKANYCLFKYLELPDYAIDKDVSFLVHYEIPRLKVKDIIYPLIFTMDRTLVMEFDEFTCYQKDYTPKQVRNLVEDLLTEHGWDLY